jgi:hypothetical protein
MKTLVRMLLFSMAGVVVAAFATGIAIAATAQYNANGVDGLKITAITSILFYPIAFTVTLYLQRRWEVRQDIAWLPRGCVLRGLDAIVFGYLVAAFLSGLYILLFALPNRQQITYNQFESARNTLTWLGLLGGGGLFYWLKAQSE